MPSIPLDMLKTGASELGIELSDQQLAQFDEFCAFMLETNAKLNLTRITQPEEIVTKHLLDSLLCLQSVELPKGGRLIDVGTGAGFPGIALKIARPDLLVTLLDGTFKKVGFLSEVIERLGIQGVSPIHARAEDLAQEKDHRERYDAAFARALSDLKTAAELCLGFVRLGGRFVAQKGPEIDKEIDQARPIIGQLGGVIEKTVRTHIPDTDIARTLVVIVKAKPTPARFPRSYAQITRSKAGR